MTRGYRSAARFHYRSVERNPLRAGLVKSAKDWRHGSLWRWNQPNEPAPPALSRWPLARLPNWNHRVDTPLSASELKAARSCVDRGRPTVRILLLLKPVALSVFSIDLL
ncbi:hypothetical protein CKO51_29605 [Rhodopirellula sp. SM50]|nr:hypothetical protein CKO51_29605 [Rhodopirellula sp. SM50]